MDLIEEYRRLPRPMNLPFPEDDYRLRQSTVRAEMAKRGIDVLVISNTPNICYLTGYDNHMARSYCRAVVTSDGPFRVVISEVDVAHAFDSTLIDDVVGFPWYANRGANQQLADIVRDTGGKTIGLEMKFVDTFAGPAADVEQYLTLSEAMPESQFVDATDLIMDIRLKKSPRELEYMRKAGEFTYAGLRASIEAIEEGRTDNEIVAAGYSAMIRAGSELMSIDPMIMVGERTGWMPHNPYKRVPIRRGDPVYMEYTGTYLRYNAPTMRTAVLGEPSAEVRRYSDACLQTLNILLEEIRAGRTGHEVAVVAKKGLAPIWDEVYWHAGFGYAIGLGFQPTWTEADMHIAEGIDRELESGMTFHLPICVWKPGGVGVGFSESIVVTSEGNELLSPGRDRQLAIRP